MSTSEQCLMTEEPALTMPGGAFIDGVWQRDDLTVPVIDPEDGRLLAYVADSSPADVAAAVSGVHESVSNEDWPLWARSESLREAARLMEEQSTRFAHLIASEGVKTHGRGAA